MVNSDRYVMVAAPSGWLELGADSGPVTRTCMSRSTIAMRVG
jgi:hypothetical protein